MNYYRFDGQWFRSECEYVGRTGPINRYRTTGLAPIEEADLPGWAKDGIARHGVPPGDVAVWHDESVVIEPLVEEQTWAVVAMEQHGRRNELRRLAGLPEAPVPDAVRHNLLNHRPLMPTCSEYVRYPDHTCFPSTEADRRRYELALSHVTP